MTTDILEGLNPAQRQAVESIEGPVLVVAGPGSGKTRVITHRIAYLCRVCGVSPARVLAVTFTNKAAREMQERLAHLMGLRATDLTVGTFHAFCAMLLRRDGQHVGVDPSFTIFDDEDQMDLLKLAAEEASVDPRRYPLRGLQAGISRAKSLLLEPEGSRQRVASYYEEMVQRVYERYQALLARNRGLDFDDLLLKAHRLLYGVPEVRAKYQRRFVHLLVDEFQDTNVAQYEIAKLLAGEYRNICAVGDPDQSIYSWRNADIRNILSFQRDFPDARVITLSTNYRSTEKILQAARHLIAINTQRLDKALESARGAGHDIVYYEAYDEEDEAQFVLREVQRLLGSGVKLRECAVLYRINAQSRALEEACLRYGMPYRLVGGVRFYQRREVKDVIAYLRLLQNSDDEVSLLRVVNTPPRGIGQKTLDDLGRWARAQGLSLYAAMRAVAEQRAAGETPSHPLAARAAAQVATFMELMERLRAQARETDVVTLLDAVVERTGYRAHLLESRDGGEERWENLLELRNVALEFKDDPPPEGLARLLERVALISDVDRMEEGQDALTLITLHQAKGLEFGNVFMVGLEEGLLPHMRSMDDPMELEEERRLCYVGMTRAKDRLYLARAVRRGLFGGSAPTLPSRFLKEVPQGILAVAEPPRPRATGAAATAWGASTGRWDPLSPASRAPQRRAAGDGDGAAPPLREGDKVRHRSFGVGVVVTVAPSGDDHQVTVAFEGGVGVKRLLLSLAGLEKV